MRATKSSPSAKAASTAQSAKKAPAGSRASGAGDEVVVHTKQSDGGTIIIKGSNENMGLHVETAPAAVVAPDGSQSSGDPVGIKGSNHNMGLHIERKPEPAPPEPGKPPTTSGDKPIKGSNDTQGLRVVRDPKSASSSPSDHSPVSKGR